MEKTILTQDQVESLVDVLGDTRNDNDVLLQAIQTEHLNEDNSNAPLEEGEAEYLGEGVILENSSNALEFNHFENLDSTLDEIINNNLKDNLSEKYNMSDEEVIKFANLITKVRANEKFNVYDELPEVVKSHIDNMVEEQKVPAKDRAAVRQYTAKMIVDELIHDSELDALSIDLEKAMKELIPAPLEMYSEFNKEYIENEFLKVADSIKEEKPQTAENLLNMRQGYIDAYTYSSMYEVFKKSKVQKHVRRAEVEWNRTNTEYLRLAGVCKFNLYSLADLHKSLMTLGYSDLQAKRIATLFVYTYTDGVTDYQNEEVYNDIYRNAFANYFEVNVKNLALSEALLSDFSKQIKEDLEHLCDHIDDVMIDLEVELSNKKKKKRG